MISPFQVLPLILPLFASFIEARSTSQCKSLPGDADWPSGWEWKSFNRTVNGSLIRTVPIASVCHEGLNYNASACAYVNAEWSSAALHYNDPTSVMTTWYQGNSCIPTLDPSIPCTLGGYPIYVLNATGPRDIQAAVNFARDNNIRLVVKNTGHDFAGKSLGAGALSIWTHHLKNIEFIANHNGDAYNGSSFKVGTGTQAKELYAAARSHGVTVVGGEGQTVGVAGGFILGGGHSPLSSIYGMAADHLLAMEVVTADGKLVNANAEENADLFWALSGGGPAAFGVVTSVTIKAHPVLSATGVTFTITNVPLTTFWSAMRQYFSHLVTWAEAGTYHYSTIFATKNNSFEFSMAPFFAPNKSIAETNALLSPWYVQLSALNITVTPKIISGSNFYDAWIEAFPLETVGNTGQLGSRLFPRQNFAKPSLFNKTFDAIKQNSEDGYAFLGFNLAPTLESGQNPKNSVNPAWRKTILHAMSYAAWDVDASVDQIKSTRKRFTEGSMQRWRDITPGSGAYLNEMMVSEPNFQQTFYGNKYASLYKIKQKWDPKGLFYAITAVGSEDWVVATANGLPTADGRLCRK